MSSRNKMCYKFEDYINQSVVINFGIAKYINTKSVYCIWVLIDFFFYCLDNKYKFGIYLDQ